MTDRELLELAAKAAGLTIKRDLRGEVRDCTNWPEDLDIRGAPLWYPLENDGDAQRLMVALKLDVTWTSDSRIIVRANRWDRHGVPYGSVIARATEGTEVLRRAIVEAAAQIGRACTSGETS